MNRLRKRTASVVSLVLAGVLLATCGSAAPATDTPAGVVRTALDKLSAKDLDGMRTLACAGQEDIIRDQLGLPTTLSSSLLPGLDMQALMDAVRLDVSKVKIGDPTVNGDTAQVPVSGDLGVTFDADKVRPILRQVLASQGTTMSDEQLDGMLKLLESYGQAVPLDQSIRLVREGGAWKICQQTVAPSPS